FEATWMCVASQKDAGSHNLCCGHGSHGGRAAECRSSQSDVLDPARGTVAACRSAQEVLCSCPYCWGSQGEKALKWCSTRPLAWSQDGCTGRLLPFETQEVPFWRQKMDYFIQRGYK
ncbi:unnamed protein product, partial [Polarella glacialis]